MFGRMIWFFQNLTGQVINKSILGWFENLSNCFLSIKIPKLLILASCENMDSELMIGQMQGKFGVIVISNVGHIVQEDEPKKTAEVINNFVKAFKIPALYKNLKPIVSQLHESSTQN